MTDEEWFARLKVEHPVFYELMMNTKKKDSVLFGQMMADIHRVNKTTPTKVYKETKSNSPQMEFQL